jgi:hypothetical protein
MKKKALGEPADIAPSWRAFCGKNCGLLPANQRGISIFSSCQPMLDSVKRNKSLFIK